VIFILKKRSDFLSISEDGIFLRKPSLLIQVCLVDIRAELLSDIAKQKLEGFPLFYGITASKKVGNAIKRNKAKRRIRALLHLNFPWLVSYLDQSIKLKEKEIYSYNPLVSLSRKTINGITKKIKKNRKKPLFITKLSNNSANFDDSCEEKKIKGLAFVFIANKHTPIIGWERFENDFRKVVQEGVVRVLEFE
jgi:ribonuclease P protein component